MPSPAGMGQWKLAGEPGDQYVLSAVCGHHTGCVLLWAEPRCSLSLWLKWKWLASSACPWEGTACLR